MTCPACGKPAQFTSRSGVTYDPETGPDHYEYGMCSECGARIDVADLERIHESECRQLTEQAQAAYCPVCKETAKETPWGYTPAIPVTLCVCLHYACNRCIVECNGCLRKWCKNCLTRCLECGGPLCMECAVSVKDDEGRHFFHAACVPLMAA